MDLNRNQQLAAIALIGLALIGLGLAAARPSFTHGDSGFAISEPGRSPGRDVDISVDDKPGAPPSTPEASILVHVAGRVRFPNVYRLAPGSRVIDAVKAAGGSHSDAYLDAVNLAAEVKDGEQVYIPSRNNRTPAPVAVPFRASTSSAVSRAGSPTASPGSLSSSGKLKTPGEGYVNINTADLNELQRLPGVGPSTAQKIIDRRSEIRRFTSADQLMDVKGLGAKKLEKMRPFVTL